MKRAFQTVSSNLIHTKAEYPTEEKGECRKKIFEEKNGNFY